MSQTRLQSFIEACINVLIGFAITVGQNLFIGVLYTIVSVARSYAIRRWFNARLHAAAQAVAGRLAA